MVVTEHRILFRGRFLVAPSSYTKLVRAMYHRQRIYLYLVQFSGMLHSWLQRYHARIRTLGSSLVMLVQTSLCICKVLCSSLLKFRNRHQCWCYTNSRRVCAFEQIRRSLCCSHNTLVLGLLAVSWI